MQMVLPLLWVVEIDGVAVKTPVTKLQLEALIQQLDEDGLEAVMQHLGQTLAQPDAGGEALKN